MEKKLYRDEHRKMIGGVCAGIADYFGIDVTIIRIVALILLFGKGVAFLPYIVLWIVLPKRGIVFSGDFKPGVDYRVPPQNPFGQPFGFPPVPPKKKSNISVVIGAVLIVMGSLFLIDEFNIIPDWDFERLWPLILVAIGISIIFTGKEKQPWKEKDWNATIVTDQPNTDEPAESKPGFDLSKKTDDDTTHNPTSL